MNDHTNFQYKIQPKCINKFQFLFLRLFHIGQNMDDEFDEENDSVDNDDKEVDPDFQLGGKANDSAAKKSKARPKQKSYKKKVERKWSDEDINKLIKEIETRPVLWNAGLPEYKLSKEIVWQEVADAIPAELNDCKGKWGNLRTTFNTNLAKLRQRKSGQGADETATISWKFFNAMMFMETTRINQSTSSTSSMELVMLSFAHIPYN